MKSVIAVAAVAGIASAVAAQSITVSAAPSSINPGESYTVQIIADISDVPDGPNLAAFAGFGLEVSVDNGTIDLVEGDLSAINSSFLLGATVQDLGGGAWNLVGGQLANLFGFANPNIVTDDVVVLATFTVSGAAEGFSTITVTDNADQAAVGGGGTYYFDSQDGAAGRFFVSDSATVEVVPTPAAAALLGLGGLVAARRRR